MPLRFGGPVPACFDRVSFYTLVWPGTYSIAQAGSNVVILLPPSPECCETTSLTFLSQVGVISEKGPFLFVLFCFCLGGG